VFTRKPDQKVLLPETTPPRVPVWSAPASAPPPIADTAVADTMPSVIGHDLLIEGQSITIRCKGALQVNGNIRGDLHSRKLVVGPEAKIMGSIAANDVEVFGSVHGAIYGTHVLLQTSARVDGDIHSQHLQIESGASFDGRSRKVADARDIAPKLEPEAEPEAQLAYAPPQSAAPVVVLAPAAATPYPGIVTPPRDRLHS
jgi:cytoskeletal protein CcmA (bactofilin family)